MSRIEQNPAPHGAILAATLSAALADRPKTLIAIVLSACIVLAAAFVVGDGLFIVDEAIYLMAARAFAETGSFTVSNGWEVYGSNHLRLWFLHEGPEGIAPQYPSGSAILTAPLLDLMGARAFVLLNACAAVAALWLTYLTARRVYSDEATALLSVGILGLCTFLAEYAFGIWPHAMTLAAILAAIYCAVRATEEDQRGAFVWALLSGLAVGAGFLLRLDSVLILPTLAVLSIVYARHPAGMLLGGALGFGTGLAVASIISFAKFGSYNPLSYGMDGTGTTVLAKHVVVGLVAVAGVGVLFVFRRMRWTPQRMGIAALLACTVVIAVTPFRLAAVDVSKGLVGLLYDMTIVPDTRPGVEQGPGSTRLFFGVPKKALAQSLPWLGLLAFLLVRPAAPATRKWHLLVALTAAVWMLPFAPNAWHGGFGMNMRYFLPLLPLLSILAAHVVVTLQKEARLRVIRLVAIFGLGVAVAALWPSADPDRLAVLHQVISRYLFIAIAVAAFWAALRYGQSRITAQAALLLGAVGFGVAAGVGVGHDFGFSQKNRAQNAQVNALVEDIEGPVLLYANPTWFAANLHEADRLLALPGYWSNRIDPDLVKSALNDGRRVFARSEFAAINREMLELGEVRRIGDRALVEVLGVVPPEEETPAGS